VAVQKNRYVDINQVIVTSEGGRWHLPEGRTQVNETFEIAFGHGKTAEDTFSIFRD